VRIRENARDQVLKFGPHSGSSAGISLKLITRNLCVTSRDPVSLNEFRTLAYPLDSQTSRTASRLYSSENFLLRTMTPGYFHGLFRSVREIGA
jgi:hypothetical protein